MVDQEEPGWAIVERTLPRSLWLSVDDPAWREAFDRAVASTITLLTGNRQRREQSVWAAEVAARPHRPAEWTVRNEPLDRDR